MSAPRSVRDLSHRRILVVDDEQDILDSVADVLELHLSNAQVVGFRDPRAALRYLGEHEVHVILADYRMPGMDGLTFLRQARLVAPHASALMWTGHADMELAHQALSEGRVKSFLTKPVSIESLVTSITTAMASSMSPSLQIRKGLEERMGSERAVRNVRIMGKPQPAPPQAPVGWDDGRHGSS